MNKFKSFFLLLTLVVMFSNVVNAQVNITGVQGQSVATLVSNNFIAEGIELVTTPGYQAKFNGQTTVASNQIGTFTNSNTTTGMPIDAGIVLATAGATNSLSGGAVPASDNCLDLSPALYQTYHSNGGTQSMNNVACLTFYVIPKNNTLSFRYSFASFEYPGYVCSQYNDVFGLFITGPLDENGNLMAGGLNQHNIALIPPDYTTPVMINTINAGVAAGSTQPCVLTNTQYFGQNSANGFPGYTKELSTEEVDVWACYMYKLELAVCDIGDKALNSAVFLKAHSLQSQSITINNSPAASNGLENVTPEGYKVFNKGCSTDTLSVVLGRPEANTYTYIVNLQPSTGSSLTQGVDYTITDEEGNPTGTNFHFAPGDTVERVILNFLHNEDKTPGTQDTLYLIPEFINECTPQDTIKIILVEPEEMISTIEGGKTYCSNELPAREFINVSAEHARTYLAIEWTNSLGESGVDTVRNDTHTEFGDFTYSLEVMVREPMTYTMTISDSCGRSYTQTITYQIQAATTSASVDREYICEGESVNLSCPETAQYHWTAYPTDMSLMGVNTEREPEVSPSQTTLYTITITDENGCIASDTIRVTVVPAVEPRMSLNPHSTTLSNSNVIFEDLTVDGARREWDFGDGTTSTQVSGVHSYPTSDTGTYIVTLVVYNAADCEETITDTVYIKPDFVIYIANAIETSADDQRIAIFQPIGTMEWFRLDIFNRWGTKVFEGEDNQGWDGYLENGKQAPQGTYVYDLYYKDDKGLLQRKTGSIAVLPKMEPVH